MATRISKPSRLAHTLDKPAGSIVGFTLLHALPCCNVEAALVAQQRVVRAFSHLRSASLPVGESRLEIWGHGDLLDRVLYLDDGSVVVLVGSPVGKISLEAAVADLLECNYASQFVVPWEGRVVLLKVSGDGLRWCLWNDWVGSVPVWHAQVQRGRLASTLEPVVVSGAGFSSDDISLPALVSLLINGHFLGDSTLYRGMAVVPPDCAAEWDKGGFHATALHSVEPTDDRAETAWDDLVDEMEDLSRTAIAETLAAAPNWVVPLSAGLDSRLIAAVAVDLGVEVRAYNWGSPGSVDVVHSHDVADALGIPWAHIELPSDYLVRYTPWWADWFGSSLPFHGMYQMAFFDAVAAEPPGPVANGFLGDILRGHPLYLRADAGQLQLYDEWHWAWPADQIAALVRRPIGEALEQMAAELDALVRSFSGSVFKRAMLAEIQGRQRVFTSFQATLADYWRGVASPFMNRAYARFCLSLPRPALENEHLLDDMFRRHHSRMARIPGTYGSEPLIRTGRYLGKRKLASLLPRPLRVGPLLGFRDVAPRMDHGSVRANGWKALWPIPEARARLADWLDLAQIDAAYQLVRTSEEDARPLRQIQSVQTLAYRLLDRQAATTAH